MKRGLTHEFGTEIVVAEGRHGRLADGFDREEDEILERWKME